MINSLFKMTDYGRYASIPGSVIWLNTFLVNLFGQNVIKFYAINI